jgi:hypothetical protein
MGKWKRLPDNPPTPSPTQETPLERTIAAEEAAVLAAEERALEALAEAAPIPPLIPFVPPLPAAEPLPPEPAPTTCIHSVQTYLYVTTTDGFLYILDPLTGAEINHYRIIDEALAGSGTSNFITIDPVTGMVYLSNFYNAADYGTNVQVANDEGILATINVGNNPGPAAIDTRRGLLYQSNLNNLPPPVNSSISVIDLHTNTVIGTITFPVGERPILPIVDPITGEAYVVGDAENPDSGQSEVILWHIDPESLTVTRLQVLPVAYVSNITADFAHDAIYIAGGATGQSYIAHYNISQDTLNIYYLPDYSFANLVYDPTNERIYLTGSYQDDPDIFIFDPAHPGALTPASIPSSSNFGYGTDLDPEHHILYVVRDTGLAAYNTTTWQLLFTHDFGSDQSISPFDVKLGYRCDQWAP